jgi:glutathione S-transferase
MSMATREGTSVRVERSFAAPRERVFDAWTNEDVLRDWWSAMPTMSPGSIEVDFREGGRYRMEMVTDGGEVHTVVGEYREIRRPELVEYTWTWEGNADAMQGSANTLVRVEFAQEGAGTLVTLTHSGFEGVEIAGMHEHGWNGTLAQLAAHLAA